MLRLRQAAAAVGRVVVRGTEIICKVPTTPFPPLSFGHRRGRKEGKGRPKEYKIARAKHYWHHSFVYIFLFTSFSTVECAINRRQIPPRRVPFFSPRRQSKQRSLPPSLFSSGLLDPPFLLYPPFLAQKRRRGGGDRQGGGDGLRGGKRKEGEEQTAFHQYEEVDTKLGIWS